jgi:hypothetical protein
MKTFMSGFGANAPMAHMHPYGGLKGTLLESHVTDINTGETTSWITTKVDRSGMTIRKADYTFSMAGME